MGEVRLNWGMGPRIREDTGGEAGWTSAPVFTGAGYLRGIRGGCTPILTFPPEGGRERGGGDSFFSVVKWNGRERRRREFSASLCCARRERLPAEERGMGPRPQEGEAGGGGEGDSCPRCLCGGRISTGGRRGRAGFRPCLGCEDTRDGLPLLSSRGRAICEDRGGCTPILAFPPEGGRERRGGWVRTRLPGPG